ncbi:MAG: ROK family protein [Melioribacteraceae bacterium]|nr:ROK family protein [Melioribacteraceae bacterium]
MKYNEDKRTVMTLDAGGTNFVFSAIKGNKNVIENIVMPSNADDLDKCLYSIIYGFEQVKLRLNENPVAISFAFPGPADYPNGIIGDLQNLPAFRGGIALGPMLAEKFGIPVYINNDGDLYAYGEALSGYLPDLNEKLEKSGSPKRFKNLLGLTLGTGFGAGIVRDGNLLLGDNSIAGEIWLSRDKLCPATNIEEHASIRGIKKIYIRESGISADVVPEPKDIYEIALGKKGGNINAAKKAFEEMGEAVGDAISNAITLIDGIAVIGGGLSGAAEIFLPAVVKEMNSNFINPDGTEFPRLVAKVYNLEDEDDMQQFVKGSNKKIKIPGTEKTIQYDSEMRVGIGISKIGTSSAISLGAYAFALNSLDK